MKINFRPLKSTDFPLLLSWLKAPHVRAWWDLEINWTTELIEEKYGSYVNGYKEEGGIKKELHAFIIYLDNTPIGYIQTYNAHDFQRSAPLHNLPKSLAAFDIFIGDKNYIGKGVGSKALELFCQNILTSKYDYIFADPDIENIRAIRAYERAGFYIIKEDKVNKEVWMIRRN